MKHIKFILTLLTFIAFTSCLSIKNNRNGKVKIKEISTGYCNSTDSRFTASDRSPSGRRSFSNSFPITDFTDTIPRLINNRFGVNFEIFSKDSETIEIDKVWTFPSAIVNTKGQSFKTINRTLNITPNRPTFTTYIFEQDFEMVKGEWKLELFHKGKRLYIKKFIVQ